MKFNKVYAWSLALAIIFVGSMMVYFSNNSKVSEEIVQVPTIGDDTSATTVNSEEPVKADKKFPKLEAVSTIPLTPTAPELTEKIVEAPEVIVPNYSGYWSGKFIANSFCGKFGGDWTLRIYDNGGTLTGNWNSTDGTSGDIKGTAKDAHISFNGVYGDYVLITVDYDVIGNEIVNGVISRTQECLSGSGPVPGTITGSKK